MQIEKFYLCENFTSLYQQRHDSHEHDGSLEVPFFAVNCIPAGFFGLFVEILAPAPFNINATTLQADAHIINK